MFWVKTCNYTAPRGQFCVCFKRVNAHDVIFVDVETQCDFVTTLTFAVCLLKTCMLYIMCVTTLVVFQTSF